ncbi:MAG: hypothetical protein LBC94_05000 [Desulfovibrio sp.]|nr:hypothetical protein [Desulfovibrio sp.]
MPAQRARKQGKFTGLLNGVNFRLGETTVEEARERGKLTGLESLQVSFRLGNGALLRLKG